MIIYLFATNKIYNFSLPKMVQGNFSFDINSNSLDKLINVEARNNKWYLYSTSTSQVLNADSNVKEVEIVPNNYYVLKRNNQNYLLYITHTFDNTFCLYSYDEKLNLTIGNTSECNLRYQNSLIDQKAVEIKIVEKNIIISVLTDTVYINNYKVSKGQFSLKIGDEINIYGLRLLFFSNYIFINNPNNQIALNVQSANIRLRTNSNYEGFRNIEISDRDLYLKEDYYLKSPRLRRTIKTADVNITQPPQYEKPEELPAILSIGPMLTMGLVSVMMLINNIMRIANGQYTLIQALPQLVSSVAMLLSTMFWPTITKKINKKLKTKKNQELNEKYGKYLQEKREELVKISNLQKEILIENLIPAEQCVKNIFNSELNFWDKRMDQSDFLVVRIGHGDEKLDVRINYPEEGFSIDESKLKKQADALVEEFKYIKDVPISYSLFQCKITALMGVKEKVYPFMDNIILQLLSFYSYDEIKFVVFTDEKKSSRWEYIRYLNHSFSNDKSVRFFSTNMESAKNLGDYLSQEIQCRIQTISNNENAIPLYRPYYIVIVDNYDSIRRHPFMKILTELDINLGFSLIILEDSISRLPSKCSNFISLGTKTSGVLKNSYEEQDQITFYDEINPTINMLQIAKIVSNIPIEFQEGTGQLPESLTFLEMEKVGKVEQLNILNRWNMNDSTQSLKAEVGVDEEGNILYLDLHEKFHGPHGLIAGMTGSGKSEFIITYILSMAMNYSPDDVAFILIDYKGGGLAFAFENKTNGIRLPHLAGTITNLDKAEMNRTLVSIDSEVKKRQKIFNEARDALGESTMDIYKYQRNYKEGRLKEPVPHLFIICDEFAELKSQQPEFMDDLISIARIGRSLGVHLILATQKPSGVVNDQIWSNTKFRVCLKVQSESDSREMLKRPEAASLKQAGRFYLQVGFDEYFVLGQSGWCGAKYFPSDRIIKQEDKSINFISDIGNYIKSIQAGNSHASEAQGEQLSAILKNIIEVAKQTNKKATQLWLNSIDATILIDDLIKKYNVKRKPYDVQAIIGEYDAPENQEQGLLLYSLKENGNTIICGNDEVEKEMLINTIIYSMVTLNNSEEFQFYMIDYGSESSHMFSDIPHCGGIVYSGDDERFKNLIKFISEEVKNRKKMFASFGGSIEEYNRKNDQKMSQILLIINNFEAIVEIYSSIHDELVSLCRDCVRYGIYIIISCSSSITLGRRLSQNFENHYALHFTDPSSYYNVFEMKVNIKLNDAVGRGIAYNNGIHEFQTASIVDEEHNVNDAIDLLKKKLDSEHNPKAKQIPSLPETVSLDIIQKSITSDDKIPIGIARHSLKTVKFDFFSNIGTVISSNKIENMTGFIKSLMDIYSNYYNMNIIFIDFDKMISEIKGKKHIYYYNDNLKEVFEKLLEYEKREAVAQIKVIYYFYGVSKVKNNTDLTTAIDALLKEIKNHDNHRMVFVDGAKKIKSIEIDSWYSPYKNNSEGIWIGKGFSDQQVFRIPKISKEMSANYSNSYGYVLMDGEAILTKAIEFYTNQDEFLEEEDESSEE